MAVGAELGVGPTEPGGKSGGVEGDGCVITFGVADIPGIAVNFAPPPNPLSSIDFSDPLDESATVGAAKTAAAGA